MATEEERLYVEKVGLYFEQLTLPRMAGRIFGWLLISESTAVTMSELVDVLQASKSSVSTMLHLLMQVDLVEQTSLPGIRKDYYCIHKDAWTKALKDRLAQAVAFRGLADEGLSVLEGAPEARKARLQEMREMYAFLEHEIPLLLEQWEGMRRRLGSS